MKKFVPFGFILVAACVTEAPTGIDRLAPNITIAFPDAVGESNFTSPDNAPTCVTVRRTSPARVNVSVGDPGGLQRVIVKSLEADIDHSSVTYPRVADIVESYVDTGSGEHFVLALTRPSASEVRTGIIVSMDIIDRPAVSAGPWVAVEAHDYAGNRRDLGAIQILPAQRETYCSNLRESERRRRS